MKLRLLFFVAFLALASCSGDDTTPENSTPVENKNIKEIKFNDADGGYSSLQKYQDNKLTEYYMYVDGVMTTKDLYTYNNNGLLVSRQVEQEDLIIYQTIEYDSAGRIVSVFDDYSSFSIRREFDYTSAHKVTMSKETYMQGDFYYAQVIFDLLPDGRVYKITSDYEINEVAYAGNNIISRIYTDNQNDEPIVTHYNYTYDSQTLVKGKYLAVHYNKFGGNVANQVLYSEAFIVPNDNYLIADGMGGTVEYEFDADAFPVKQLNYTNNTLDYWFEITYE